ncbi:nucleolar complex protein 3 homolog [Phymastichus coffea]|uniref:nucleolar complex protein 3 homolog n=1 Tax=Phymastichus coffea TaxID=108790 RepID=UPI00273C03EF|nr:nucleolar complex protein 3 homolog [Phymastichus coffea]
MRFEDAYLKTVNINNDSTNVKLLLPTKNEKGLLEKRMFKGLRKAKKKNDNATVNQKVTESHEFEPTLNKNDEPKVVSLVQLLSKREEKIKLFRYQIGILSSEILENPTEKLYNFQTLLNIIKKYDPDVHITVQKLVIASLLEIFKDLLPFYTIKSINDEGTKLKKETLALRNFESSLLKYYKQYLQKLEKISGVLKQKQHSQDSKKQNILLGTFAIKSMCDLLLTKPYFNFASNISHYLVPFLNNHSRSIRTLVATCFGQVFKEDKKGEISLNIVQGLNKFIKAHKNIVHMETISVMLNLRLQQIDLDKEKEVELKNHKLMAHKNRIRALSKKERKRKAKLEGIEKELLETKGNENQLKKQQNFTDIANILFTIYFRILKQASNNNVLTVCLEGLSKFSDCINIDIYQDLIHVLDGLLKQDNLTLKQRLHCIYTISIIISKQGSVLNIDPTRFYTHLYKYLLDVDIGKNNVNIEIIVKILRLLLITRRNGTQKCILAFLKRTCTMALSLHHDGTLAILTICRLVMQNYKTANILLDTDCTIGDGSYLPELDDPEYCNAHCTSLWETVALQRHYHTSVGMLSKYVASDLTDRKNNEMLTNILKLSPESILNEYEVFIGKFKPTIPFKNVNYSKNLKNLANNFDSSVYKVNLNDSFEDTYYDFYKEMKNNYRQNCIENESVN